MAIPLGAVPDILLVGATAAAWCLAVRRRFRLLFAIAFVAAVLPDLVDLGPAMLREAAGTPASPGGDAHLARRLRLDVPRDGHGAGGDADPRCRKQSRVSTTNHVVAFAVCGIASNLSACRFFPDASSR